MLLRLRRLLGLLGRDAIVLWYACRNPAAPLHLKLAGLLLALYVVSPIDLLPDGLPVLGWMDDITLLALGIPVLLKLVSPDVLRDARFATDRLLSRIGWRPRKP